MGGLNQQLPNNALLQQRLQVHCEAMELSEVMMDLSRSEAIHDPVFILDSWQTYGATGMSGVQAQRNVLTDSSTYPFQFIFFVLVSTALGFKSPRHKSRDVTGPLNLSASRFRKHVWGIPQQRQHGITLAANLAAATPTIWAKPGAEHGPALEPAQLCRSVQLRASWSAKAATTSAVRKV